MAAGVAWVLNLDADVELGSATAYTPSARVLEVMKPHVERLRAALLGPDDLLVDELSTERSARGRRGRAFCPTPRAIRLLERAGAVPEPHPTVAILRAVNSRAFASSLGPTLPGAVFVTRTEDAHAVLASRPPHSREWRLKQAFGMAGRNQRVVRVGTPNREDQVFIASGIAAGGVQIEPNVVIDQEYALHAVVEPSGTLHVGALVRQECDGRGAWLATLPIDTSTRETHELAARMCAEVEHVGAALSRAGYFGPFGVDAFSYRGDPGALHFQPRSEINARYSMGFSVGFPRTSFTAATTWSPYHSTETSSGG